MANDLLTHLRKATEKLSGVKFTDEDMKVLTPSLRRIFAGIKTIDELGIPSDVLPATLLTKVEEED